MPSKRKRQANQWMPQVPMGFPMMPQAPGMVPGLAPIVQGVPPGVPQGVPPMGLIAGLPLGVPSGVPQGVPQGVPNQPFTKNRSKKAKQTAPPPKIPSQPLIADPIDVFGALATWKDLPSPKAVQTTVMVDFDAVLNIYAPNQHLYSSVRVLDSGLSELNWNLNQPVLDLALRSNDWNEPLVEFLQACSRAPNCLLVVHTGRVNEQSKCIEEALTARNIYPNMIAHRDPLQPYKARKNQLIQRLWQYFSGANFSYYQGSSNHKDTRDTRLLLQSLADYDRPLPQLFEISQKGGNFSPVEERQVVEQILSLAKQDESIGELVVNITTLKWVWRITNYEQVAAVIDTLGAWFEIPGDITTYNGHYIDYNGSALPTEEDIGKLRTLTAHSVSVSGTKVTLNFPEGFGVVVATINKRVDTSIQEIEPLEVKMTLDTHRLISIKEA